MSDSGIQFRTDAFRGDMAKTEAQYLYQQGAGAVQGFQQGVQAVGGIQQIQQQAVRARMDQALHEYEFREFEDRHQMFGMELGARAQAAQVRALEMQTERARFEHDEWLRQQQKNTANYDEMSQLAYRGQDGKIWVGDAEHGTVEADPNNPLHSIQMKNLADEEAKLSAEQEYLRSRSERQLNPGSAGDGSAKIGRLVDLRKSIQADIQQNSDRSIKDAGPDVAEDIARVDKALKKRLADLDKVINGLVGEPPNGGDLEEQAVEEATKPPLDPASQAVQDKFIEDAANSELKLDPDKVRAVLEKNMTSARWRNVMSNPASMRHLIEMVKAEAQ